MIEIIIAEGKDALIQYLASRLVAVEAESAKLYDQAKAWRLVAESLMGVEKEY